MDEIVADDVVHRVRTEQRYVDVPDLDSTRTDVGDLVSDDGIARRSLSERDAVAADVSEQTLLDAIESGACTRDRGGNVGRRLARVPATRQRPVRIAEDEALQLQ